MKMRDLRQKLRTDYIAPPQLARFYVKASYDAFGVRLYVPQTWFDKFNEFERKLRSLGYSSKDYAYTIIPAMKPFIRQKFGLGMVVPMSMFLGEFCLKKYIRLKQYDTVSIVDENYTMLLDSEMKVARLYIERNIAGVDVTEADIVNELYPLLSEPWLKAFRQGKGRPIEDVIDMIAQEYNVSRAHSYADIIRYGHK